MKRPLGVVTLFYAGGLLLGEFFPAPLALLFSASLAVAALAIFVARWRHVLIWPLLTLAGWTNFIQHTAAIAPDDLRAFQNDSPEIVVVRGVLTDSPDKRVRQRDGREDWRTQAQVCVQALRKTNTWVTAQGRIVASTPGLLPPEYFAGQQVEITGVLGLPPGPLANGLFDYRQYLRRQGIYFLLTTQSSNDWQFAGPALSKPPLSDRFRAWAHAALAKGLPAEDLSLRLEWALSLGDKSVLTEEVSEPFVRAATYHIFAVDGLRMAILFGIFLTLFRTFRLPRAICGLVLIPLIWFYTALTGWPASAIRASIMLTIVILGWSLKRPSELVNSLFAAAFVILLWDPQQLFQAGFQLSFFVVLCIVLVVPAFDRVIQRLPLADPLLPDELRPRWYKLLRVPGRFVLDLLLTSFSAWIGSLPLVAYYFHIVTPVSTPANLLAVPLCALVLTSNFISLMLAAWFSAAAELFNHAGWFLMECIRVTSVWFADWPRAYWYVAAPHLYSIVLYYALFVAASTGWLFKREHRRPKIAAVILLSAIWCWQWQHDYFATRLTVLPVSGGSAVFVDRPGRARDVLIDCGNSNAVGSVTTPFLRGQGVNRLASVAVTHGDLRQMGGIGLLRSVFDADSIATSPVPFRSPSYRALISELGSHPEQWRQLQRDELLSGWLVLHPDAGDRFPQADDNALVVAANVSGMRLVLLSDLSRTGQDALIARYPDLRADIVITGLPAGSEPVCNPLLDALRPRLIIVADAELPVSKRASPALQERLRRREIPVIYTREAAAATVCLRRSACEVTTMSGIRLSLVTTNSAPNK